MSILLPISSTPHRCGALLLSSLCRALFLLHLIQLLPACSFYRSEVSLEVRLPAAPQHWQETFGELSFRILYPAGNIGAFEEKRADSSTCVVIQIPKILHLPVLAYPDLPGQPIELPPSGGVYPLDCDMPAESITLSWHRGASAVVLYRLWAQGVDCSPVNVPRLCEEIAARCQGDPWALDLERICGRLAAEEFRLTDIRLAPSRDLLLVTGTGDWFLESPFRAQISAQADGSLLLRNVPLGTHILFESPPAVRYFLYVQEDTVLMIRR
jgi:hypothetical protein